VAPSGCSQSSALTPWRGAHQEIAWRRHQEGAGGAHPGYRRRLPPRLELIGWRLSSRTRSGSGQGAWGGGAPGEMCWGQRSFGPDEVRLGPESLGRRSSRQIRKGRRHFQAQRTVTLGDAEDIAGRGEENRFGEKWGAGWLIPVWTRPSGGGGGGVGFELLCPAGLRGIFWAMWAVPGRRIAGLDRATKHALRYYQA
jgi:hypothetical protein